MSAFIVVLSVSTSCSSYELRMLRLPSHAVARLPFLVQPEIEILDDDGLPAPDFSPTNGYARLVEIELAESSCISSPGASGSPYADSRGFGCDRYDINMHWCGFEDSRKHCCACGGGVVQSLVGNAATYTSSGRATFTDLSVSLPSSSVSLRIVSNSIEAKLEAVTPAFVVREGVRHIQIPQPPLYPSGSSAAGLIISPPPSASLVDSALHTLSAARVPVFLTG